MEVSILVHCRTHHYDFNPEFLAKPNDFTSSDIKWAREHILPATSYGDELNGIRRVVFNNSKFGVFGIVGLLDEIMEKYGLSDKEIQRYSYDENGRKIKCFIGYVFDTKTKQFGTIPEITDHNIKDLLQKYIAKDDIFFAKSQPQILVEQFSCVPAVSIGMSDTVANYSISSEKGDFDLQKQMLARVSYTGEPINLCTNVYNIKMVAEGKLNYFTSDQNTIQRYMQKLTDEEGKKHKKEQIQDQEDIEIMDVKKKDVPGVVYVVSVVVLIAIIILIIILM